MLNVSKENETRLTALAAVSNQTIDEFIETLLENYQDELEIKEAEQALQEPGGISLSELKAKYGL